MNVITELVWLIPIVVGVTEVAKRTGVVPARFAGVGSLVYGVIGAVLVGPDGASNAELVVGGIATGLAACGLYGATKATAGR